MMTNHEHLSEILQTTGQSHLVPWLQTGDRVAADHRDRLQAIDWRTLHQLWRQTRGLDSSAAAPAEQRAERRFAPPSLVQRLPQSAAEQEQWAHAREVGEHALQAGKVAVMVVAGGQGTRLGFDRPKGFFPIGPVSGKSLFQHFCEQLCRRSERVGVAIPYAVMTSDATDSETRAYFQAHRNFGLDQQQVRFFCQGNLPALDWETGSALLSGPGELSLNPDGHGGMLRAFEAAGLLAEFQQRGIEVLYYHQVDNPCSRLGDPEFIGWHLLSQADVSTKVVAKQVASERVGLIVEVNGQTQIIEYSDLPEAVLQEESAPGRLRYWAGNTAMHVFSLEFLARMAADRTSLPYHVARKAVAHWHPEAGAVRPTSPNACKFEQFIFDLLPRAARALVIEADRATEFNPVKNATGSDSPATAKAALTTMYRQWLADAQATVVGDGPVEISPRFALDAEDLQQRLGTTSPTVTPPMVLE